MSTETSLLVAAKNSNHNEGKAMTDQTATDLQALDGGPTEPEPITIYSVEELTEYMRRQASAGNVGDVLALLGVAKDMGGEELCDRLYGEIARPIMQARKNAWLNDEPGAAELTEDEMVMLLAMVYERRTAESITPGQADKLRMSIRRARQAESTPDVP